MPDFIEIEEGILIGCLFFAPHILFFFSKRFTVRRKMTTFARQYKKNNDLTSKS